MSPPSSLLFPHCFNLVFLPSRLPACLSCVFPYVCARDCLSISIYVIAPVVVVVRVAAWPAVSWYHPCCLLANGQEGAKVALCVVAWQVAPGKRQVAPWRPWVLLLLVAAEIAIMNSPQSCIGCTI